MLPDTVVDLYQTLVSINEGAERGDFGPLRPAVRVSWLRDDPSQITASMQIRRITRTGETWFDESSDVVWMKVGDPYDVFPAGLAVLRVGHP